MATSAAADDDGSGSHTYKWPRPALTVDTAIVAPGAAPGDPPALLLIQRKNPPCKGQWALPGVFTCVCVCVGGGANVQPLCACASDLFSLQVQSAHAP